MFSTSPIARVQVGDCAAQTADRTTTQNAICARARTSQADRAAGFEVFGSLTVAVAAACGSSLMRMA